MDWTHAAQVAAVALFAGAFGAMMGVGGGVILVPGLIALLGLEPRQAVACSVISVVATSSSGAIRFLRQRLVDVPLALQLEGSTVLGSIVGAYVAYRVSGEAVAGLFALFLLYAAFSVALGGRHERASGDSGTEARATGTATATNGAAATNGDAAIRRSYIDPATGGEVFYRVRNLNLGRLAGLAAGVISALLGVGGGIVMVPAMAGRMELPIRVATATSTFMIGITAAATAVPYLAHGEVNPRIAAICTLGVMAGARLGSLAAGKIDAKRLRWLFGLVLLYTAGRMALRAGLRLW
ncbi:MAG: sulfite exporter TauE/SafE family protein [Armatimonadetes bacterium]|nr:sulfite exporter TauE/SafE family protein [Armatimonadota bacterium]